MLCKFSPKHIIYSWLLIKDLFQALAKILQRGGLPDHTKSDQQISEGLKMFFSSAIAKYFANMPSWSFNLNHKVDLKSWMTFGWIPTYVGPAKDSNLKILFLVLRLLIKRREWQWMTSLWLALWGINDYKDYKICDLFRKSSDNKNIVWTRV